jgi:hypothetical protein
MAEGKKTGGRKPGTLNKRTVAQLLSPTVSPLEFLTGVYLDGSESMARRVEAAKAAAPYRHHRLGPKEYLGLLPLMAPQVRVEPRQIMQWMIDDLDPRVVKLGEEVLSHVTSTIAIRKHFGGVTLSVEDAIQEVFEDLPELEKRVLTESAEAGVDLINFTWLILAAPRNRPDIFPPNQVAEERPPSKGDV